MRIVKHIPNTITSMNLLSGTLGVIFTLNGRIDIAFPLMLAAAGFDFFDGMAARLLGAYSEIGKELDSLADIVSFGVLPAIMMYSVMDEACGWIRYIPLLIAVFSALRLAKFNLDERQHGSFIGLPTPACAMICGSMAYFVLASGFGMIADLCATYWFVPVISVCLGLLLVCEIPMFSMKFGKGAEADKLTSMKRVGFIASLIPIAVAVVVLRADWSLFVLLMFAFYLMINIIFAIFQKKANCK